MPDPATYNGVKLLLPVEHEGLSETQSFLRTWYKPEHLAARDLLPWQGQYGTPWNGCPRPGTLVWPTGALRWAEAAWYVGKTEADAILTGTSGTGAANLVLNDGASGTITASMYALPPRPVIQHAGDEPLYLLPLVDQRFFWQLRRYSITNALTTAADLITALQTILGITITVDSYSSTQLAVPLALDGRLRSVPALLDMVAQSLGLRVVCSLSGAVRLMSASNGTTAAAANAAIGTKFLGGRLGWASAVDAHTETLDYLPSSVLVSFPGVTTDGRVYGDPEYQKSVPITLAGQVGNGDVYDLLTLERATFVNPGSGTPTNQGTLDTYATTYATAWYNWQKAGSIDVQLSGIAAVSPDGCHRLEWNLSLEPDGCLTRLIRESYDVTRVYLGVRGANTSGRGGALCVEMTVAAGFEACLPEGGGSSASRDSVLCVEMLFDTHFEACLPTGFVAFFYDGTSKDTNFGNGMSIRTLEDEGWSTGYGATVIDIQGNNYGVMGVVSLRNDSQNQGAAGTTWEYRVSITDIWNTVSAPGPWTTANDMDTISFDLNSGYRTVNQASSNAWLGAGAFVGIGLHWKKFKIEIRSTGASPPDGHWQIGALWLQ